MTGDKPFVIVGASLAGAKAAETLRSEGFDGRVVLVGQEQHRPYQRPPLSKEYLRGEKGFDDAAVHTAAFYDDYGIELRTGTTVTGLDLASSEVTLHTGERVAYGSLLLATGAAPRRLSVPGAELDGVHYLRTVDDANALGQVLGPAREVVVIGAGWVGSEVAASARQLGAHVALVELAATPLQGVLGPQVGAIFAALHVEHGVKLHMGLGVSALAGAGAVREVHLTDGSVLPADVVIVGVGAAPRTELAEMAGLATDNGVLVDERLATAAPAVYAAGDVANAYHPRYGTRLRLEHWSAALNQGPAAARNMLGAGAPYDRTPYFYSDQYAFGMEYRGWAPRFDQVVFRGDPAGAELIVFWLGQGRVLAAMNANVWDVGEALEALVNARAVVAPERLADPDVDLAGLNGP